MLHCDSFLFRRNSLAFKTTRWTIVNLAGNTADGGHVALEELCNTYWKPLFLYLRHRGYSSMDAEEHLQAFFLEFLEKKWVEKADSDRGKFRTYLLTALNRFLSKSHEKSNALKRGKKVDFVHIDRDEAESLHEKIGSLDLSPEQAFERQWAYDILDQALSQLDAYYARIKKEKLFAKIRIILVNPGIKLDFATAAKDLGMKETAVRVAIHRMKDRYRRNIVSVIEDTVTDPQEVDAELKYLMEAVSND